MNRRKSNRPAGGPRRPQSGFTLIEVVAAITILAMGVTSVLSAVNGMTDTHRLMERQTEATLIAREVLTLVQAQIVIPGAENTEGEIEGTDYRYRVVFTESQYPNLYGVSVKVEWGDDEEEDPDSVLFYRLQYYG